MQCLSCEVTRADGESPTFAHPAGVLDRPQASGDSSGLFAQLPDGTGSTHGLTAKVTCLSRVFLTGISRTCSSTPSRSISVTESVPFTSTAGTAR